MRQSGTSGTISKRYLRGFEYTNSWQANFSLRSFYAFWATIRAAVESELRPGAIYNAGAPPWNFFWRSEVKHRRHSLRALWVCSPPLPKKYISTLLQRLRRKIIKVRRQKFNFAHLFRCWSTFKYVHFVSWLSINSAFKSIKLPACNETGSFHDPCPFFHLEQRPRQPQQFDF